jgi:hypothetical protein
MIRIKILFPIYVLLLLNGCKKPSDSYTKEPKIEYKSFTAIDLYTAQLIFKFTDGDGDIGLRTGDTAGIYSINTPYYYNLYIKTYYKNYLGQYVDTAIFDQQTNQIDSGLIRQRIQFIENETKEEYLRGEIIVDLYGYRQSTKHKNIKYKIFMYDRAKNKSNEIETPELIVP